MEFPNVQIIYMKIRMIVIKKKNEMVYLTNELPTSLEKMKYKIFEIIPIYTTQRMARM